MVNRKHSAKAEGLNPVVETIINDFIKYLKKTSPLIFGACRPKRMAFPGQLEPDGPVIDSQVFH